MTSPDGRDYPAPASQAGRVEPAPRRVRGFVGATQLFDTVAARYVWEWPYYPQYYIPLADIAVAHLHDEGSDQSTRRGTAHVHGLRVADAARESCAKVFGADAVDGVRNTVRFDWTALDAWFEEDEQVFVHPRSPYVRVDALRSHRHVEVELDGVALADSNSPVLVFETGLPTRFYLDRSDIDMTRLLANDTVTQCPYKGTTSAHWSVRPAVAAAEIDDAHRDLAWSYDFPTRELAPVTGLVAFSNERVDISVDGVPLPRPHTKFS